MDLTDLANNLHSLDGEPKILIKQPTSDERCPNPAQMRESTQNGLDTGEGSAHKCQQQGEQGSSCITSNLEKNRSPLKDPAHPANNPPNLDEDPGILAKESSDGDARIAKQGSSCSSKAGAPDMSLEQRAENRIGGADPNVDRNDPENSTIANRQNNPEVDDCVQQLLDQLYDETMAEEGSSHEKVADGNMMEASNSDQPSSSQWCADSEIRLFKKILSHKPAGVSRHFNMMCLVDYMNNVYEDEDTDFDDVLTPEDLREFTSRKNTTGKPRVFKPKYKIRPTPQQIWDKLYDLYDMPQIEENEYLPEGFLEESEFSLPEDSFSELLRKKTELNRKQNFVAPQTTGSRSAPRRKRRDSGETQSSRSSTPASRDPRKT